MRKKSLTQLYASHTGKVSDKWSLYLVEYDQLFSPYRNKALNLLEIGIQNGGSLEIWAKYFKKAKTIIGCDINPDCASLKYDDTRISVVVGDANSTKTYQEITNLSPTFDLLIDDGSHTSSDIIKSFIHYFPHINNKGLFIAEDLHCSYWKSHDGGLFDPFSSISFFKLLADIINHEHWGIDKKTNDLLAGFNKKYSITLAPELFEQIHSVTFINSICVIQKQVTEKNKLGKRFIAGMVEPILRGHFILHGSTQEDRRQTDNKWSIKELSPYEELPIRIKEIFKNRTQIITLNDVIKDKNKRIKQLEEELETTQNNKNKQLKVLKEINSNLKAKLQESHTSNEEKVIYIENSENIVRTIYKTQNTKKRLRYFLNKSFFTLNDQEQSLLEDINTIDQSNLFSPLFYLKNNPDVLQAGLDPLLHYCNYGWKEKPVRIPTTKFDMKRYLQDNPDLIEKGINPLIHYINSNT